MNQPFKKSNGTERSIEMSHEQVDTRITAYIFGELSRDQKAVFEQELEKSPSLQAEVAAMREAVSAIETDFQTQSVEIGDVQRSVVEKAIADAVPPPVEPSVSESYINQEPGGFSRRRLATAAALAACLLIVVGLSFPFLGGQSVSMENPDSDPPGSTGLEKRALQIKADREKVAAMLGSFNEMILNEQYDDAEEYAFHIAKLHPEDPVSELMVRSSQMALQLRAVTNSSSSDNTSSTPVQGEVVMQGTTGVDSVKEVLGDSDAVQPPGLSQAEVGMRGTGDSNATQAARQFDPELGFGYKPPEDLLDDAAALAGPLPAKEEMGRGNGGLAAEPRPMTLDDYVDADQDIDGTIWRGKTQGKQPQDGGMMGMQGTDGMDMMVGGGMWGGGMAEGIVVGDRFAPMQDNEFAKVSDAPLSTFSIDVDTASYAKVRSMLNRKALPAPDSVRIEELLNYFDYGYAQPAEDSEHPFAATMQIATCPWAPTHRLARIGIKGRTIEGARPSSNLVFLLDVSGSMDEPDRLPLVIDGMKMLTSQLTENDRVAIVVYAGAAGTVLDSTRGDQKRAILKALDRLKAGGSTNGGQGIQSAYDIARDNFVVGGTNRVILCSDGDFNVGVTGTDALVELAQENAKSNVFLSVLGFGIGNHNDAMMEQISNHGNGNYAFIDNRAEAKKVLVDELGGTLVTIAKDVKIQIEFNPREVASYRLIGYENRVMAAKDFNDDRKDAGEIGAGHTVTALYEIVPTAKADGQPVVDDLRYQRRIKFSELADSGELLTLKLRYKQPEGQKSRLIDFPVKDAGLEFSEADRDFKFAAAVAAFGMVLRDSPHKGLATMAGIAKLARDGARGDMTGRRIEFVELVSQTRQLRGG
ncbi:MAG: von Willebrand factor type A domain-containing protein [Rubripirellula sp.]